MKNRDKMQKVLEKLKKNDEKLLMKQERIKKQIELKKEKEKIREKDVEENLERVKRQLVFLYVFSYYLFRNLKNNY